MKSVRAWTIITIMIVGERATLNFLLLKYFKLKTHWDSLNIVQYLKCMYRKKIYLSSLCRYLVNKVASSALLALLFSCFTPHSHGLKGWVRWEHRKRWKWETGKKFNTWESLNQPPVPKLQPISKGSTMVYILALRSVQTMHLITINLGDHSSIFCPFWYELYLIPSLACAYTLEK